MLLRATVKSGLLEHRTTVVIVLLEFRSSDGNIADDPSSVLFKPVHEFPGNYPWTASA
jgi:hypothetical protein